MRRATLTLQKAFPPWIAGQPHVTPWQKLRRKETKKSKLQQNRQPDKSHQNDENSFKPRATQSALCGHKVPWTKWNQRLTSEHIWCWNGVDHQHAMYDTNNYLGQVYNTSEISKSTPEHSCTSGGQPFACEHTRAPKDTLILGSNQPRRESARASRDTFIRHGTPCATETRPSGIISSAVVNSQKDVQYTR